MLKYALRGFLVVLAFSFATATWAGDIEESDARKLVKKAEKEYNKFKGKKVGDLAPEASITAGKYLDKANQQIAEEEWDVAYYFAGKCIAYINLGYAIKYNKEMQKKLKDTKKRLK